MSKLALSVATTARATLAVAVAALAACTDAPTDADDVAAHTELVRARIEASNRHDWDAWQAMHTSDATRTAPELVEPLVGSAAMRAAIEELTVTFPDYHLELVEAFGVDDRLMARIHATGTMTGPIEIDGTVVPPTGRAFQNDWVGVLTFDDDKISAIDEFYDSYGILVQLGLTP